MKDQKELEKTIGGFFQLQLSDGEEYYPSLIKLNTTRNALEYILKVKNYTKIYIPYFTCDTILEPMLKLAVPYEFYTLDQQLDPIINFEIGNGECFLYTNYFGLKQNTVEKLSKNIENLIIDNSQAFFSKPLDQINTIYSCRKFFGVSDGAYLQLNSSLRLKLETDISVDRFLHLIKSIDLGNENAYQNFVANEKSLENNDIKNMSVLTQKILSGINYQNCKKIRKQNFNYLQENLAGINELDLEMSIDSVPMIYPFLLSNDKVKTKLIEKKIFVPTFWPNVLKWTNERMFENHLAKHLVPLPIDHRYTIEDMKLLVCVLKDIIHNLTF
ncbi:MULTISPECIES: hypothetical protein [Sphingobacterium]|uniref:hypothetical protein n=1 Tax=Sphingobacterium TaxID=28453 RepID=UPI0013DA238F|nr:MULTISPECIES: hypothetical protein [unclassified Sphingobacterium]